MGFSNSGEVAINRLALNMTQVRDLNPPENPAKITDTRAKDYIRRFGTSSWELDAIEPSMLASLVRAAVTDLIDNNLWQASGNKQDEMRAELQEFSDNYNK